MTVKELIEKLNKFPQDMTVIWEDAIEGNDSPLERIFQGACHMYPFGDKDWEEVVYLGPRKIADVIVNGAYVCNRCESIFQVLPSHNDTQVKLYCPKCKITYYKNK